VIKQGHITFTNYVWNFIQHPAVKVNSQSTLMGIISVDFNATSHLKIKYSAFGNTWEKMGIKEVVHQLFIDFKKDMIQVGGRSCVIWSFCLASPWNWKG
jgi:hypothetical protein